MTALAAGTASVNSVTPGLLGFLVVAGMALALYFLFRSLNKQLHKITPDAAEKPGATVTSASGADPEKPAKS